MFPGASPLDSSARGPAAYDRRHSHSSNHHALQTPTSYGPRTSIELPRPLEPRPSHQSQPSRSDTIAIHSQHAPYRPSGGTSSDGRIQGQSLPGLRDILIPPSQSSAPSAHHLSWPPTNGTAHPPPPPPANEAYYGNGTSHLPPTALHPPMDSSAQSARRVELPILETSPHARPSVAQSLPVSPYTPYPEPRGYTDAVPERTRQTSTTSYLTNGVSSPYTPGTDDTPYRNGTHSYDRGPLAPPPGGSDSGRRYLGIKDVPGEGSFHLYDGGYRIPTQVDGEQVNPAWGLTKANKPRKRLALACLDCREKKIKCEPSTSGCIQCEKAKRPCRRAPANPTPSEAAATPGWQQNGAGSPGFVPPPEYVQFANRGEAPDALHKRRSRDNPTPPNVSNKKPCSTSPHLQGRAMPDDTDPAHGPATSGPPDGPLSIFQDPYEVNSELTLHLVDLYLVHVNNATYAMFSRGALLHWMKSQPETSQEERMVIYAMLAMGSVFADEQLTESGKRCAQIAADAIVSGVGKSGIFSVQTRIILSLYSMAMGDSDRSCDYAGAAIRACTSARLKLQIDDDLKIGEESNPAGPYPYGFNRNQLFECRRRTFWAVFLLDRFQDGTTCGMDVRDIFLRLPCSDASYEQGTASDAPFFNNGIIDSSRTVLTPASNICPMGWLTLIAAIWGDVLSFTNRTVHRADATYRADYEKFHAETHAAVEGWQSRLPEYLRYTDAHLDRSIYGGYTAMFVTMHALHHFIFIRMNRYMRHASMPDALSRNIREAYSHAQALLSLTIALQAPRRDSASHGMHNSSTNGPNSNDFSLTAPFVGNAVVAAIDVVGAGGLDSNLGSTMDAISGGIGCLRELARAWAPAREQFKSAEKRDYQIKNILSRPYKARSGAWLGREWGMKDRMEQEFRLEDDCIYADDGRGDGYTRTYFDALQESAGHGHHHATAGAGPRGSG